MNAIVKLLKEAQGRIFTAKDGEHKPFTLLPPLTKEELRDLERRIPCPLPDEMREVFDFARGFTSPFEVDFAGLTGEFGLEEIFPYNIDIATDGCGNFWIIDLLSNSTEWGPIFYACHDAPVIVFQTASLEHFIAEVFRRETKPWVNEIDDVSGQLSSRIWLRNPNVLSHSECLKSADPDLKLFATTLEESWQIIDLRSAHLGDGFSWGRYGPGTHCTRFIDKRIFAYQKKTRKRRFLEAFEIAKAP